MRILTLNAWGTNGPPARISLLLNTLCDLQPEILCLQEGTIPGLLGSLPYTTCFHSADSGLAILSSFPTLGREKLTYPVVSPLEPHRRQALAVNLDAASGPFWVITTHLAWKKEDGASRLAQVEELLDFTRNLVGPLLLAGDLNATPDEPPMQRLMEAGFQDLFAHCNPGQPGITWDNANPFIQSHSTKFPDRRIDYVLVRKNSPGHLNALGCEVACRKPATDGLFPSDHYGVLATLRP